MLLHFRFNVENMAAALPQDSGEGQSAKELESIIECIAILCQMGKTKLDYVQKGRYVSQHQIQSDRDIFLCSREREISFSLFIREEYLGLKYRKMPSLLMKSILSLGVRAWDDQSATDAATI